MWVSEQASDVKDSRTQIGSGFKLSSTLGLGFKILLMDLLALDLGGFELV